jgi:uncharacterized protein YkwD
MIQQGVHGLMILTGLLVSGTFGNAMHLSDHTPSRLTPPKQLTLTTTAPTPLDTKKTMHAETTPRKTPTHTKTIQAGVPTESVQQTTVLAASTHVTPTTLLQSTVTPTQTPPVQPNTQAPQNSLNPDVILQLINTHRANLSLPSFEKNEQLCAIAESRGPQLYDEIFVTGKMHSGLYNRNLPFWITENMAHYPTEQAVFSWWLGSPIHRKAIEGDYTFSCGTCHGTSCAQLFTSFTPK